MSKLLEHVARNRAYWDDLARQYVEAGERAWAQEEPAWGVWRVPEAELQLFSEQLSGKDAIELGWGTAYISAWFSRRGVRVVGIDNSEAQLDTARRLQRQYGLDFQLIHCDAEAIVYPDASFDFAISEYGACCVRAVGETSRYRVTSPINEGAATEEGFTIMSQLAGIDWIELEKLISHQLVNECSSSPTRS